MTTVDGDRGDGSPAAVGDRRPECRRQTVRADGVVDRWSELARLILTRKCSSNIDLVLITAPGDRPRRSRDGRRGEGRGPRFVVTKADSRRRAGDELRRLVGSTSS